jgi:Na+-transporting methylmalonyl-CoA/oxaloacetate decarboxylase gamma subunit
MMALAVLLKSALTTESIVIAVVGYLVVFTSLVLLFWLFNTIPKLIYSRKAKKQKEQGVASSETQKLGIEGETTAAISLALHLYFSEVHDEESGILTIKKVSKAYSPWSSKIYAVRNQFNRL